jgi:hypothetical protein
VLGPVHVAGVDVHAHAVLQGVVHGQPGLDPHPTVALEVGGVAGGHEHARQQGNRETAAILRSFGAEQGYAGHHADVPDAQLVLGQLAVGQARDGCVAVLVQHHRDVDPDLEALEQAHRAQHPADELGADDGAQALIGALAHRHQRIVGKAAEELERPLPMGRGPRRKARQVVIAQVGCGPEPFEIKAIFRHGLPGQQRRQCNTR